jgi:hypothetical protein
MLRVKNFEPQWGYAPAANRFGRTISIILVATAIGAISGGGVVLSLVDLPTGQASARPHTLAAPVQALIEAAQPNPSMDSGANGRLRAAPADIAPLAEVALNEASVKVATPPSAAAAPAENKTTKNRRVARHAEPRVARGGYGAWGWGGTASHLY